MRKSFRNRFLKAQESVNEEIDEAYKESEGEPDPIEKLKRKKRINYHRKSQSTREFISVRRNFPIA